MTTALYGLINAASGYIKYGMLMFAENITKSCIHGQKICACDICWQDTLKELRRDGEDETGCLKAENATQKKTA